MYNIRKETLITEKKVFEDAELQVILFDDTDVIATSSATSFSAATVNSDGGFGGGPGGFGGGPGGFGGGPGGFGGGPGGFGGGPGSGRGW